MIPNPYTQIKIATENSGFNMASDVNTCYLLRSLVSSKVGGRFLELGTGTGLATSFILDGMDETSSLISVDNDERYLKIATENLQDKRVTFVHIDGGYWIEKNKEKSFDFIFADTWHGKYLLLEEILGMVKIAGFYIIDDMLPQANWPEGHDKKVENLVDILRKRNDFSIVEMNWASGIIIATRKY